jgi:ligand-binding sensor domain-containing protein
MRLDEATSTLWIATNQGAFYRQEMDMHGQNWTYVAGLPSRDVTTVLPMPDGSVWLGTANAGLVYFK